MKRKAIVIIEDYVLTKLIEHANNNPEIECGGFLYGTISPINDGVIHVYVTGIFSGFGLNASDNRFFFSPNYIKEAREWGKKQNIQIIGMYHSHGIYKPVPSKQDLVAYNSSFKGEGISIIYSPSYGIHADYICRDTVIIGNDIYVKNSDGSYRVLENIVDNSNHPHKRNR